MSLRPPQRAHRAHEANLSRLAYVLAVGTANGAAEEAAEKAANETANEAAEAAAKKAANEAELQRTAGALDDDGEPMDLRAMSAGTRVLFTRENEPEEATVVRRQQNGNVTFQFNDNTVIDVHESDFHKYDIRVLSL